MSTPAPAHFEQGPGPKFDVITAGQRVAILRGFAVAIRAGLRFKVGKPKPGVMPVHKVINVSNCSCCPAVTMGMHWGVESSPYRIGGALDFGRNIRRALVRRGLLAHGSQEGDAT
jgi:hypothetical protein